MSERPTADELVEAVREFLAGEILPAISDDRLRFRTLVALNTLGIISRELANLPPENDTEQRRQSARIRAGEVLPGTLALVRIDVQRRLRVASPQFLEGE